MISIKPGRGLSIQPAVGSMFVALIGIIWTIGTAKMGAPMPFSCIGILFLIFAIAQFAIHMRNATSENRWSLYDITEEGEEPDPLEQAFGQQTHTFVHAEEPEGEFCPYCGAKVGSAYAFCRKCGKKL